MTFVTIFYFENNAHKIKYQIEFTSTNSRIPTTLMATCTNNNYTAYKLRRGKTKSIIVQLYRAV